MVNDRFLSRSAIFVALFDTKGRILLHRRRNTGYADGRYDMPSGHVEQAEQLRQAASRELSEETTIVVDPKVLRLWHINQVHANSLNYYNFFFTSDKWTGKPSIGEPEKCDDMRFFVLDDLPSLTAATYVALQHYSEQGVSFGYIDQAVFDTIVSQS